MFGSLRPSSRIRTCDLLFPKQTRYQTALYPVGVAIGFCPRTDRFTICHASSYNIATIRNRKMPYKDPQKQREYQRRRWISLRTKWIKENGPCTVCDSSDDLEVDHVDPEIKVTHNIWSWSTKRRSEELKKCQVLCSDCHKKKTAKEKWRPIPHGTDNAYTKRCCRCKKCRLAHRKKRKQDLILYGC